MESAWDHSTTCQTMGSGVSMPDKLDGTQVAQLCGMFGGVRDRVVFFEHKVGIKNIQ
jgi:hypothetical protein